MTTSQAGRKAIELFEGLRLQAYRDQRGIWTIGYGHTGAEVVSDLTITEAQADELMAQDLHHVEDFISSHVTVRLTQNQFDALVSLVFNIGVGNFGNSTLLKLLNESDYLGAANQFLAWDKTNGEENQGLLSRRILERTTFVRS